MDRRITASYQNDVGDMVSKNVHANASYLIGKLSGIEEIFEGDYAEELREIQVCADWVEPAKDHIRDLSRDDCVEWLESQGIQCYDSESLGTLRDAVESDTTVPDMAREFCERFKVEVYEREAFEHWIVSEWLAGALRRHGEMVTTDFYGLTIWGRVTSGQAIKLDGVICDIYDEVHPT